MFTPLSDTNPIRFIRTPVVAWSLIGACILCFLLSGGVDARGAVRASFLTYGLIPAILTESAAFGPDVASIPAPLTLVTHQFLHAGWLHLIGNMLFLWVFGDNVEDAMGHARFAAFYVLCGIAGGLAHIAANPASQMPLVGASGAISGILAAYLLLYPRARVFGLLFQFIPLNLPVSLALGSWIALQVWHVFTDQGGGTAWFAHLGGLIAGALLVRFFIRPGTALFSPQQRLPVTVPRIPLRRPPFR